MVQFSKRLCMKSPASELDAGVAYEFGVRRALKRVQYRPTLCPLCRPSADNSKSDGAVAKQSDARPILAADPRSFAIGEELSPKCAPRQLVA